MTANLIQFLLLMWIVQLDCEVYQDHPKIKSEDGNLILLPAADKNIYLTPNGPHSGIFVGNVNLLSVIYPNSTTYQKSVNNDLSVTNPPTDIIRRIEALESLTTRLQYNLSDVTFLSRRVSRLFNRVATLQTILNSLKKDECESQQCQHGGTCLNLANGYHCLCPPNWEGKNCETDVNECRNFAGTDLGCQNGATCINRPGSYECLCRTSWFGLHCTRRAKDCQEGDFEMCGHGTCIKTDTGVGIKCLCNQGWTTNGTQVACLTDVNECDPSLGPRCSVNPKVDCINLPGSFRCGRCPSGYDGDGFVCYDIDECVTLPNGGCSTSPMVTCHNTIGSRMCGSCPSGYEGDGINCAWRGSCFINHGGCHPSARCIDTSSMTQCICPAGMIGDGIGINGCYIPTYTNVTQRCEGNPCGPNGQCHPLRTGYTCICFKGYSGAHCVNNVDLCASNPCLNGGTCRLDETSRKGFRCECSALFVGVFCEVHSKPCGGVLDADEGSIVYPMSNTTYEHNSRCAWVIHTTPDKVINVTFSKFSLENDTECQYDFLQIHDGRSSASQLIGRFCGSIYPKGGNIISSHNNLYFWFRSDRTIAKEGFALHWSSVKPFCGGEVDATAHGHISSPGWPGKYPHNRDCYWHLSTSLGKRIQLHFFELDIETHKNCSYDYLAIYDGEHSTDPLLDKFCNSTQPAPIISAGSDILIHFHSDAYNSGYGFQIAFAPVDGIPGCGGYFTADKGEIVSPSYNDKYLNNLFCEYKIKTGADTKIHIEFKYFQLERSLRCTYDFLKIYDGSSSNSPLVGKFCGNIYLKSYTSSSNVLFIQLRTDHSMVSEGFKMTYESLCYKSIFGDSGILKSPGYPFSYPSNKICEYEIRTRPGKSIVLTFQDFDIENNQHFRCQYDYVEIRDGLDRNATLLGKFCGGSERIPPAQTSSFNYMYIRFVSDMSISGTGFYANYTTIDTSCGGIYRDNSATINHPSVGDRYSNGESCTWILWAPEGMHILLTWNRFDLEDMSSCSSDYVQLIEIVDNMTNNILGTYCGITLPPALTIATNRLMIKFESDNSIEGSGFSLSYTFLDEKTHCGGLFVNTHGYIYSPGWPRPYEPNRDCNWTITVPVGHQILLNISNFDLERPLRDKCDLGDYLEIRNGASNIAPLIGKYCGNFLQKQIISTANSIYLHFHSDFYLTGKGFKITWDGTITGCGGTSTSTSGSISSPNYPQNYDENSECFYKIVTSSGSRIRIMFMDLELERTQYCTDDYVEIFDGRDPTSTSLGKFCYMKPELNDIETTSNYAFIIFRSDFLLKAKGFLLNYETICNANLSGAYGVIESPGFPSKYPTNSNCLWTITVTKGSKINITFTHFDILQSFRSRRPLYFQRPYGGLSYRHRLSSNPNFLLTGCDTDYLQMKEATVKNFTEKLCGSAIPSFLSSKTNSMQIKFVSGGYFPRTGFRLEWVRSGCGGIIRKRYGALNLDKKSVHSGEMECEWIIESSIGTSITLKITELVMSTSTNCSIDGIEVYNGQSASSPLLSTICHSGVSTISTTGNIMFIKFIKKSSLRDVYFTSQFSSHTAECGGRIQSRSGFIYSKNYPKNYDNNLDCIWFITVPLNHRIELNIMELDLYKSNDYAEDDTNCDDMIKIYDGGNIITSNYTYRICPGSKITQIVTQNNNLAIQFVTDGYNTAKGFKANFTMTCGAIIEAIYDGIISNDKYRSPSVKNCTWTILAPKLDQKIKLTISHMSIPQIISSNRRCSSSFLKVFDGNDDSAPLINEYCGRTVPAMLVSHGSAMTIQLGTHADIIDGHFSAHYSSLTSACGGSLTSEEGDIASPNYPNSYSVNTDCEWILSTSPGNRVYLTFESFDLEYSDGCNEDYLELREDNGGGRLLGIYCGQTIPSNTTIANKLFIKFHSDTKAVGQGFLAHYGFLHGSDITDLEAGSIASPLYPYPYENSGIYNWRIITKGSDIITINIDRLEIQQLDDICYSYLVIYDGYDEDAPVIEKICGIFTTLQTKILKTTSNVAFIKFVVDATNAGSLFHLQWTKSNRNTEYVYDSNNNAMCGLNGTEFIPPGGTFIFNSPNYPNEYANELNCKWIFKSASGQHLRLYFTEISIEETTACYADYISMYSSYDLIQWSPIKEHVCVSQNTYNYTDSTSYLKVIFITDTSITRKGFQAKVKSVCGGIIKEKSGILILTWSDIMQNNLSRVKRCDWTLKVRAGRNVKLKFDHFNITNSEKECSTYVMLRNGESAESPLIGKYCGYAHENKDEIISSSNAVYITYVSSYYQPGIFKNFILHYEEQNIECGGTSSLDTFHNWEIISSPNYPSVPVPFTECVWVFTGPPGEILRIDFIDRFDLQTDISCSVEFVEIRDGSSELSPITKRFCERPPTIKTSNNYIYIKYVTQLAEPRDGFKANVSIDLCGGTIIANSGEITSPTYPKINLHYGTVCKWHVISSQRRVIQLLFKDLNLPESESPCDTYVAIKEPVPENDTTTTLKTICDSDDIYDINSIETFTNEVIIELKIGKPSEYFQISEHRGFRLTFNSSRPSCGGVVTTPEGFLTTPGYPRKTTLRYCQWLIRVPNNKRRVRLELLDTDVYNQGLSFYNDLNFRNLIQRISGHNISHIPQFVESTGNKMAFHVFVMPQGVPHRLKVKFTSDEEALCGGELNSLIGSLQSPDLEKSYTCEWEYNARDTVYNNDTFLNYNSIYLNITVNSTVSRTLCRFADSMLNIKASILNGETSFVRKLCGNNNVSYRLPTTSILIKAVRNLHSNFNFRLEWQRQPCGGIVRIGQEVTNIFNVPNTTDILDCAWILIIPAGIRLEIKLEGSFSLDCADEYLKINQGLDQLSVTIGDYCKEKMPDNSLRTSSMYTYVQYHTKAQNITKLKVLARTVNDPCGGYLTMNDRVFASPNYPKGYPNNIECSWEIQADTGYRVSLQFVDRFAIADSKNCTKDVLIIYDFIENEYKEIAKLCGRHLPNSFNSTSNIMKVVLRTDSSTSLDGFKVHWYTICGGKFLATEKERFIYSPGYPHEYAPSLDCVYEILGSNQNTILKFEDFEFEGTYPECKYDNVTIIGQGNNGYLYETYCGREIPKPTSFLYDLKIILKTDPYTQWKGFKLSYSVYSCGGIIKDPTLITPGVLDTYDSNMNCTWIIEAPVNKIVVFKFLFIDLESYGECYNDYLAVFNGQNIDLTQRIALLCGKLNNTTIRSNSNKALMQFISDSSLSFKGFKAEVFFSYSVAVGCGGRVNLTIGTSQIIKSPLVGTNVVYENYLDCHWEVTAPIDYVIKVKFESFHVAPCENLNQTALGLSKCDCDFLELRDGINPNNLIIGRYCGHTNPPQLISSRNVLSIRLSTDGEISSSGFRILLTAERSICGQTTISVTNKVQRLTSPGYETGSMPRGLHCTYNLDTSSEPYSTVQITIINIDLESDTNNRCNTDILRIIGNTKPHNVSFGQNFSMGESRNDFFSHLNFYEDTLRFPIIFEMCGTKSYIDYYVEGSISINLVTSPDSTIKNHKGVEIEVMYLGFCGRNYTGTQGRIQSSYYTILPEEGDILKNCFTLITAPENHTISAYFISVTPEYQDETVFLEVFDGNSTNSKLELKISNQYIDVPVFSTGRYLLLHNRAKGFNMVKYDLNFMTTDQGRGCGGTIHNEIGRVTSPLYPEVYRQVNTCQWELQTPVGTRLLLRFSTFDLGRVCEKNYVELQDKNGNTINKYCEESPADFTSNDNFVKILFVTTKNNGGSGWVADFVGII